MNDAVSSLQIKELTLNVWSMMLGFSLKPCAVQPGRAGDERFVLGRVTISGAWQGSVTLGCSSELARRAAAVMFGKEPEEADSGEIRDALGELTNMVGGNYKNLLKGDCKLSVPSVDESLVCSQLENLAVGNVWFEYEGGAVVVNVERQEQAMKGVAQCR